MGKTFAEVSQQVRELVGDYQSTTYSDKQVGEAIDWAMNMIMRMKAFKIAARVYAIGAYPTGDLPKDMLVASRALLITNPPYGGGEGGVILDADSSDTDDVVMRVLDESTLQLEDAANELWKSTRAKYLPRRWVNLGNQTFSMVPPFLPFTGDYYGWYFRLHYVKMATPIDHTVPADPIDPTIPDYYQEAIRFAAVAYLVEKDTDQKSMQLKQEMINSFRLHMAEGVPDLAVKDQDS